MKKELENNGYIFVDNFISVDEAQDLYSKFKADYDKHPNEFENHPHAPNSVGQYCNYASLDVLIKKITFMSEIIQEDVYPTYCYTRCYKNGAYLKPHIDREACEISVSVNLGSDGTPWNLCFEKPNKEVIEINLTPGQGVVYLGCKTKHWREVFTGQEYGQLFLHYVRAKGENRWACFDKG